MARDIFSDALSKTLAPPIIDVFTPLGYTPHERQRVFHDLSRQRIDAILYGGAAGGGKSAALLMEAVHNAVNFAGMRVGCLRRTYNELNESFLAELAKRGLQAPQNPLGAKWNNTEKILKFPNGSIINFTYAENELDASRLLGGEYQLFCVDEASLVIPSVLQHIEERLRSGRRGLPVIGLRLATNPGGVGHTYLKNRFIKATDNGKHVATDETGRTIAYIPAKVQDNPHVNKGYLKVLDGIADPQRRKAMRDGDWDAQVGQFFEQWSRARHVVPPFDPHNPYYLPAEWARFCGIDYGYRAPFAAIWCAVDNDGRLWLHHELYATMVDAKDQALLILEAEERAGDKDVIRVADPSMWGNRGTPLTIADIYGQEGCGISQADNDRLNGWSRVHFYLNDGPACEYHRSLEWETCPMLHVFDGNCPMFVETTPSLPRSDTKPDDAETKNVDDHLQDALRYMCMAVNTHARPIFYDDAELDRRQVHRLRQEEEAPPDPFSRVGLIGGQFAGDFSMPLGG